MGILPHQEHTEALAIFSVSLSYSSTVPPGFGCPGAAPKAWFLSIELGGVKPHSSVMIFSLSGVSGENTGSAFPSFAESSSEAFCQRSLSVLVMSFILRVKC